MITRDYTFKFLQSVASRLSGRSDTKHIEYIVTICSENSQISISPNYEVYPDMHHRKHTDLRCIIDHIILTKFGDILYKGYDDYGHIVVNSDLLTPGVYHYKLSDDRKRRKWERLM